MPKAVPLTPEQLERASEVYRRTGNYSEAARAIEADVSAVRRALLRATEPERAKLHARACARGMRRARRHLAGALDLAYDAIVRVASDDLPEPPADPRSGRAAPQPSPFALQAQLTNALARASDALIALADREDRRRQAALTRAKTRAEVDAIARSKPAQPGRVRVVVRIAGDGDRAPVDPDQAAG